MLKIRTKMNLCSRISKVPRLKPIFKQNMSTESSDVLFEMKNSVGVITLNRPKALNALNGSMTVQIYKKLKEWENKCAAIIITSSTEKAFCAGGDVRACTGPDPSVGKYFFKNEYLMDYCIGTYKKPCVSLIHGITMGGGVGISLHGTYRIATDKTVIAMPETLIGLFPDVGASHMLSRLPNNLGLYLALTGQRIIGKDTVVAGFATHFVEKENLQKIAELIVKNPDKVNSIIQKHSTPVSENDFSLHSVMNEINTCFRGASVEDIFTNLEKANSKFSQSTLETLKKMSPLSMKITKKQLEVTKNLSLRECLELDYRLASRCLDAKVSRDFYEGVRALLVDKDNNPKWNPKTLEAVSEEMVDEYFKPLPKDEELALRMISN